MERGCHCLCDGVGSFGSQYYSPSIFRNGSGTSHCGLWCLARISIHFSPGREVLAVMRSFFTNHRAGWACNKIDGCFNTSTSIFDYASGLLLSVVGYLDGWHIPSSPATQKQRNRSRLAEFLISSSSCKKSELGSSIFSSFPLLSMRCLEAVHLSVPLLRSVSCRMQWINSFASSSPLNMQKWIWDILLSISLVGSSLLQLQFVPKGSGHYG